MKAVIMAGGQGSRLRPLTVNRPKPLLPLVNQPVIGHIVDWLKWHGVDEVIVTLQHQVDWFQGYLGTGERFGVSMAYEIEDVPLGTAGSVAQARSHGHIADGDTVLVVSGDAVSDTDLRALVAFHQDRDADVTVALHRVDNPLEYGMVITEGDGRISQFLEKPGWAEVVSDLVNTGIYVFRAEMLDHIPLDQPYDFSHDLFPDLLAQGCRIFGCVAEGYWTDVGTPPTYLQANADVLLNRVRHGTLGRPIGGDIWVGENVEIAPDAQLYGPIYLGNNVKIKGGVVIQGPTVIRDDTVIDNRAQISHSVIWRGSYIGENTQVRGALVGRQCVLKPGAVLQEGVVIGDRCIIGEGATIFPNVKLWPSKTVDSGAFVRESIIWGSQGRRDLFSRFGVTGVVNVDLTPEFCAKLGVAFGASLPKGSIVTINRDSHPSSRMLKRAIISGLPAAGVQVSDLGTQPVPVARYFTRVSEATAGVHVRISPHDRRVVDIAFTDEAGLNLDRAKERELERLFFREDFRRAQLDDIGAIDYASDVEMRYASAFIKSLDLARIREARFTIAVDYSNATTVEVLEPLLAQMEVEVVGLNTRVEINMLSVLEAEWENGIAQLAKIVYAMGLQLGARLDVSGSKVFLVDEKGRRIDEVRAAAVMAELIWRDCGDAVIAVPVDRPGIFDQLAAQHGGRVIHTRASIHDLMKVAAEQDVALAADGNGHFIFPAFHPAPDGMFALAGLLQFLARQRSTLGAVVDSLPDFEWSHRTVACPWDAKGRVMRHVNERGASYRTDATDGVKYYLDERRWVLVRPDPDRAILHVCVEAPTADEVGVLAEEQMQWLHDAIGGG